MHASKLFGLNGVVALVTGASSGLGAHFARTLAANGACVVLGARRVDRLKELAADISRDGGKALPVSLDVTSNESIKHVFQQAEDIFGPVTVVVNNAGLAHTGRALSISEDDWRSVLNVDLDGVWRVAKEAAGRLVAAKTPGVIINVASILGIGTTQGVVAYTVAKAGVIQLTRSLALELATSGVRINALAPGYIRTELNEQFLSSPPGQRIRQRIPFGRFGEQTDLDGPLLLLASKASAWMTGTVLVVDGGHLLGI